MSDTEKNLVDTKDVELEALTDDDLETVSGGVKGVDVENNVSGGCSVSNTASGCC